MEQTKALNALEPFLALSKTATSPRAAADLISRATAAPNTYVFAELLSQPNIAALAIHPDAEFVAWYTHLKVFSSDLYSTYLSTTPQLPALSPPQTLKLRQLSLLSLSRDKSQLSYASLQSHLQLSTARELEDVVISAVYAGLLTARLNPARQEVQVSSVAPLRDLLPTTVPVLVRTLQAWSARCDATLAELEGNVARIRADAAREADRCREADRVVAAAVAAEEKNGGGGSAGDRSGNNRFRQRKSHVASLRSQNSAAGGASKRGSEKLMEGLEGADDDCEAMDLDDDGGEVVGQKRASRRKL